MPKLESSRLNGVAIITKTHTNTHTHTNPYTSAELKKNIFAVIEKTIVKSCTSLIYVFFKPTFARRRRNSVIY